MNTVYCACVVLPLMFVAGCGVTYEHLSRWNTDENSIQHALKLKVKEDEYWGRGLFGKDAYGAVLIGKTSDTISIHPKRKPYSIYFKTDTSYVLPFKFYKCAQEAIDAASVNDTVIALSPHLAQKSNYSVGKLFQDEVTTIGSVKTYAHLYINKRISAIAMSTAHQYCIEVEQDANVKLIAQSIESCWIVNHGNLTVVRSHLTNTPITSRGNLTMRNVTMKSTHKRGDDVYSAIVSDGDVDIDSSIFEGRGLVIVRNGSDSKLQELKSSYPIEFINCNVKIVNSQMDMVALIENTAAEFVNSQTNINSWKTNKYCPNTWTKDIPQYGVYRDKSSTLKASTHLTVLTDELCQRKQIEYKREADRREATRREEQRKIAEARARQEAEEQRRIAEEAGRWGFRTQTEFANWLEEGSWVVDTEDPSRRTMYTFNDGKLHISGVGSNPYNEYYSYLTCRMEGRTVRIALYDNPYGRSNACNSHSSIRFITRTGTNTMAIQLGTTMGASDMGFFLTRR